MNMWKMLVLAVVLALPVSGYAAQFEMGGAVITYRIPKGYVSGDEGIGVLYKSLVEKSLPDAVQMVSLIISETDRQNHERGEGDGLTDYLYLSYVKAADMPITIEDFAAAKPSLLPGFKAGQEQVDAQMDKAKEKTGLDISVKLGEPVLVGDKPDRVSIAMMGKVATEFGENDLMGITSYIIRQDRLFLVVQYHLVKSDEDSKDFLARYDSVLADMFPVESGKPKK